MSVADLLDDVFGVPEGSHPHAISFSQHSIPAVNSAPFFRSASDPEANGAPHYENGTLHLYLADKAWRISPDFNPTSGASVCNISPTEHDVVAEGRQVCQTYLDGAWRTTNVNIKHLSATAVNEVLVSLVSV